MSPPILKSSGQPTSEFRLPHRPRQELKPEVEIYVPQTPHVQQYNPNDKFKNTALMCKKCRELRLGEILAEESQELKIGFLDSFGDADCQLCGTIQHFYKLRWDSQRPSVVKGRRPKLYMQSQKWSSFTDSDSSEQTVYRLIVTVDQQPSNVELIGRTSKRSGNDKYILTELEIHPANVPILQDTISFPSLRRTIQPFVDVDLIRTWFDQCESHKKCNNSRSFQQSNLVQFFTPGLRLIDVVEERLVEKTDPCSYIALSYVWGHLERPPLYTNKQNLKFLCQPLSLHPRREDSNAEGRIPRTIEDTMRLCRSLGERYLWVDSLCIVQDDPDEKSKLIHGMDRVYEHARLTVVALAGSDANAGLAGISRPRDSDSDNSGRQYLFHEGYNTHCIGVGRASLHEQIRSSYWNSRGWTYQEQLLSARKLYFTPNEVFYECGRHTRREGYGFENFKNVSVSSGAAYYGSRSTRAPEPVTYTMKFPRSGPSSVDEMKAYDRHFQTILSTYTRRNLTDPGDILNALTGIYNKYYASAEAQDLGIVALQGSPMRCFSKALLWFTTGRDHKRRNSFNNFKPSTWSWTSWVAPIDFATTSGVDYMSHSLVDSWCLSFQNGNFADKARFSDRRAYSIIKIPNWYSGITPDEVLELFSTGCQEDTAPNSSSVPSGVLEFRAPFIPRPPAAKSSWVEESDGMWHLKFGGNLCAVVRFDSGEDTASVDAFILLLFDSSYLGLCVKRTGEYFERVGVAIFTQWREDWERFVRQGFPELYWKQISLR